MSSNLIDLIILAIIFLSIILGFVRGFVSEVISLITLAAAFLVAITFTTPLANTFTKNPAVVDVVAQTSRTAGMDTGQPVSYITLGICFVLLFFFACGK